MILKQVVYYEDTNSVEATWINEKNINVKVRSYAAEQMDELVNDLGVDVEPHLALIDTVISRILPYVPPPPEIPYSVTPFQAKAAMYGAGIYNQVMALINDVNTPILTKLAWEEVTEFTRDSPLLNGLAQSLGLTSEQVDNLFIAAAQIEI